MGDSTLIESAQSGTVVIMDYRAWHRGLGNSSGTVRPVVYARYEAVDNGGCGQTVGGGSGRKEDGAAGEAVKKKRRVAPVPM